MIGLVLIISTTLVTFSQSTPVLNNTVSASGCTISKYDQINDVVKSCTNIIVNNLVVPAGKAFDVTLKTGTKLTFSGTTKFSSGTYWEGPLMHIIGEKLTVTGESGHVLDGLGADYWDGKGDSGHKKPKFFRIQATGGSTFSNINIKNCPHQCVSILNSKSLTLDKFNIDVSAGDSKGGKNTDGFDISSTDGLTVKNSAVKNQDDCVAVNSGSDLHFINLVCSGGHGLSLSVGVNQKDSSKNKVSNVSFTNCNVTNSRNGIHVKTHSDAATGYVKDVTYSNIHLSGITNYGINVQQDYESGHSTGKPGTNIPITGLTLNTITGTMTGSNSEAVYVLCGKGSCSNFNWSGVKITGAHKSNSCTNIKPSGC